MYKKQLTTAFVLTLSLVGCHKDDSSSETKKVSSPTNSTSTSITKANTKLADIKQFKFVAEKSIVALGKSELDKKCIGNAESADTIGDINVYSGFYQNDCYTSGTYNNNNYPVELGKLSSSDNKESYVAYRFSPPKTQAAKWTESHHAVRIKVPQSHGVNLYKFDGHGFTFIKNLQSDPDKNGYTPVPEFDLDEISAPTILVILDESKPSPSAYHPLNSGVEGALVQRIKNVGNVESYEVGLDLRMTPKSAEDFDSSPADHENKYGQNRFYSLLKLSNGNIGAVWQDRDQYKYYLTSLSPSDYSQSSIELPNVDGKNYMLAASTNDDKGNIYYVLIEAGNVSGKQDLTKSLSVVVMKVDEEGTLIESKEINGSKNPLNATIFGDLHDELNICSLSYSNGKLAFIYSRKHSRSGDGLNHQGADGIVMDSNTLSVVKNYGQFSGHSFSNVMTLDKNGNFLAIDLGDNYPRGINLHRFDDKKKDSRVVYTFKTEHGTSANHHQRGPFSPFYVNKDGKQTYQWSNNNATYTELGGVQDTGDGYAVIFSSEHDLKNKVLNNRQTGGNTPNLVNARNIGFIKVSPTFEQASGGGTEVSDDLVVSKGDNPPETGKYYSFDGGLTKQRVAGIKWLTHYKADDISRNASRLKVAKVPNDKMLVVWEEWGKEYLDTKLGIVSNNGDVLSTDELEHLRLNRRDELLTVGDSVWSVNGHKGKLEFTRIYLDK